MFAIPGTGEIPVAGFLPHLEELDLEGCNLEDMVSVQRGDEQGRVSETLIPLIAKLFPSLRILNLSYNRLTNASLAPEQLSLLVLQSPHRVGLRALRLRGNTGITGLEGLKVIAERFKGNRDVVEWKMEEVDVRDCGIGKLDPELGLLPLDVFLVEGNT